MNYELNGFYTVEDLCKHYGVSNRTLHRWLKQRFCKLKPIRVARNKMIFSGFSIAQQDGILNLKLNKTLSPLSNTNQNTYKRYHYYTLKETAAILRTTTQGIKKLIEDGKLEALIPNYKSQNSARILGWYIAKFSQTAEIFFPEYEL